MTELIVRNTVDLLYCDQVIEVGIVDGDLVAMVPGTGKFIRIRSGCRLRVVVSGLSSRNAVADIATYRVTDQAVQTEERT